MITVRTNIGEVTARITRRLQKLDDNEYLLRPVMLELVPMIHDRIHEKGEAADGSQIGTYTPGYMKTRARKPYNRRDGSTVILSLTRELESDYSITATAKGYGIGFNNALSVQKVEWLEKKYGKKIFSLSKEENQYAKQRIDELTKSAVND